MLLEQVSSCHHWSQTLSHYLLIGPCMAPHSPHSGLLLMLFSLPESLLSPFFWFMPHHLLGLNPGAPSAGSQIPIPLRIPLPAKAEPRAT